ncbi:MAG: chain length-determining protein [Nitrospirae bacterium]|nr:chain length-determining protein [Nitrospirota bacterium]
MRIPNENVQIDIKKYWQIIMGRRYLFIAVSMFCMSVIVWGSYFVPKMYEAQCTVLVERNVINRLVQNIAITPSLDERIRVLSYTMTSRNLIMKVVDEIETDTERDKPREMEELVRNFQARTVIKMVNKGGNEADWFSVTYRDKNPTLARDYVNTLVRRYVEENLSAKRDESYEANKFLTDQRKFFKEKMDLAEEKIITYRKNRGIFISIDEKSVVDEIKRAQEDLESIGSQQMELNARKSLIEKQLKDEKPYTVAMLGRTKGDSVSDRLIALQNRLNELLVKFTDNYPEVIRIKAEIETLTRQLRNNPQEEENRQGSETEMTTLNPIHQKLKEELSKIDTDLAALAAKARHQKERIETKKSYLRDIPTEKKTLADLERERDTYKKIDDELVLKLGQSEVSKQMEIQDKTETFRIIDPAILPTKPVSPNRVMMILAGIVAGIAAGFGTVLLLYNLDHSVKTVDDLRKIFKAPVLAVIPQIVTEEEIMKKKKTDRTVYAVSLTYLSLIGLLLVRETFGKFF